MTRQYHRTKDYEKRKFFKSKENVEKVITLYNDGYSSNKISEILSVSKSSILKLLRKENIDRRDLSTAHKKFSVNENIFEKIDTHEKAYWIGFLTADGTITNGKLKLALSIKDMDHLEKFKIFMSSNYPIHIYKQLLGKTSVIKDKTKEYYYGIIEFTSKKLVIDLEKYSITPRKSFTVQFGLNIPKEYICSYMAGLVDGDGFITISNNKIHFGFVSHEQFAKEFAKQLMQECDLKENNLVPHGNVYVVRYSGKQVEKIIHFLYNKTSIFLDRKKNKLDFFEKNIS